MGLFQSKHHPKNGAPIDETSDGVQRFFDGYFEELKKRGDAYFTSAFETNATAFKEDLEKTSARISVELKEHMAQRLDDLFVENGKAMKDAQDLATQAVTRSTEALQQQQKQLGDDMQRDIAEQRALLKAAFDENKAHVEAMRQTQAAAVEWLNKSAQAMQEQHQQLLEAMRQDVANQQKMVMEAFDANMAQVVEHYLLDALSDQYDLKAQLPSIIKQMEANKQAMADDIAL